MQAFQGEATKVFPIWARDLKLFAREAKRYGIRYKALIDRKHPDGICDIIIAANDAAKVGRMCERFSIASVDMEAIKSQIEEDRADANGEGLQEVPENVLAELLDEDNGLESPVEESVLDTLLGEEPPENTIEIVGDTHENPTRAGTERAPLPKTEAGNPSGRSSGSKSSFRKTISSGEEPFLLPDSFQERAMVPAGKASPVVWIEPEPDKPSAQIAPQSPFAAERRSVRIELDEIQEELKQARVERDRPKKRERQTKKPPRKPAKKKAKEH